MHSYYASINHRILLGYFIEIIGHSWLVKNIWKILRHYEFINREYRQVKQGICRGSALSPIFAAVYLNKLDNHFANREDIIYRRYNDDIIVLAKDYNTIIIAKADTEKICRSLKLKLRPEKTEYGQISKTFTFLGFKFKARQIITLADKTSKKAIHQLSKLALTDGYQLHKFSEYPKHFMAWVKGVSCNYANVIQNQLNNILQTVNNI